ncbi:MAG: DNA ligase [Myxococcales bacterium]
MPDLADGETTRVAGSGSTLYTLKNVGGVYSCSCPAWAHQSLPIERRTCKHLREFLGEDAEHARVGGDVPQAPTPPRTDPAKAPPLLLAHRWESDMNLVGWWLSEKLDGVRAYWDGTQFLSRLGNRYHAPPWFVEGLPSTPLDGELWGGRKQFQRTVGIAKRQDQTPLWKELLYVVFDAPAFEGVFEDRLAFCQKVLAGGVPFARVHEHDLCKGHDHLRAELARVEALGGEGLMVRKPRSHYEVGRSATLLKVKSFLDAEARVLRHVPGAGKHTGRLGALEVELANGTRFHIGTGFSDQEREAPPAVGSLVTFRYQELSDGGVPRFPSFVGVRDDVAFEEPRDPRNPHNQALRRFEMTDGDTRYFWEIRREGAEHRVRFGTFEVKVKRFESDERASTELEKRVAEKLEKGFVEISD